MTDAEAAQPAARLSPLVRMLERGRWLRGVLAWLAAAGSAVLLGATLTVAFVLAREILLHPPFTASEWWIFINLWRPLLIAGGVLVPLFSAPLVALSVWLIRRNGWRRPFADMAAGSVCALGALAALLLIARHLGPMGDGP